VIVQDNAGEAGFTLIELMVAMTIGLMIAFVALTSFDAFGRGAATNNRVTDAEDNGRRDVATMVQILRDAGSPAPVTGAIPPTVTRATANDIVFNSTAWPNESGNVSTGTNTERLCLDTATKTVWFDGLRAGTPGPTDPGAACPSTAAGWTHLPISRHVVNTVALPLFRLGAAPVRSVGITLRKDTGTSTTSSDLAVNSGSTLRGALPPSITSGDVTYTCNSDGSGKALLSLGANTGLQLGVGATGAVTVGPGQVLVNVASHATTTLSLTVTNALGLQTLLFKDVTCP
jgi:prepilin-type N-terminal cleavage/methylation domain-containing protein